MSRFIESRTFRLSRGRQIALFQQARGELERRFAFAAEHPRDFFLARFSGDFAQIGKRAAARDFLCHNEMRRRRRSDLRQVRDANHLMIAPQRLHLRADSMRDFAADVRVDLVEDEQRNRIVRGERGFDRQHQARDFAAGRDHAQRFQRFARIRREK